MEDTRRDDILDAAIKIIARDGYTHAKVFEISQAAGVASGLIYSPKFFKNKLDILLSIIINFWKTLNARIENEVKTLPNDPIVKLDKILTILEELLTKNKNSIYLFKVLHESVPHIYIIKDDDLKGKRQEITDENRKLLNAIDEIIKDGQRKGHFDDSLSAELMRQVLFGAFEFLTYGIFLKVSRDEDIGYDKNEIPIAMKRLIRKFLSK
jgi:TetR/AcrR family fatty acid metabolism transcriptional regulator